jgi:hypothetical protein|tara:strand:+ start:907 stop:1206 length:300 start_codon:yes stop_codon:yes gene_type:complete
MKTGDLVTISAYGRGLVSLSETISRRNYKLKLGMNPQAPHTVDDESLPPLVGIIIKIWKGNYQWSKLEYGVSWAGEGIPGRSRWEKSFTRKDLKMVSKA